LSPLVTKFFITTTGMKLSKSLALGFAILSSSLLAQNADPLVFTVGNSYPSVAGKSHNYLLWQPGDVTTTYGKKFAVYGKDGAASSASPYLRLGIQSVQTSPSAIQALLMLGAQFDHDADALPGRIVDLHSEAQAQPLAPGTLLPTAINIDVAQKLAQIMSTASTDPEILQSLISLGRAHPGVMMSMGHGFAIEVPTASTNTYEVREIGIGNTDIRAIGRVSLKASAPYSLPPSGRPFPNPHPVDPDLQLVASAKDHLNVRLRWAMSNTLRLALPKAYGFNLYRVPKGLTNPSTLTTEALALAEPGAVRVNSLPIAASDLFTDAEAANLAINREIFFYADDKNPPSDPFVDGETFNYFVAARDIAGHPGPLSPPTEVTMCDRLPPSQPSILSVDNIFDFNSADTAARTGKQHLRVVIQQVPELPAENSATKYRVYRWHSATDWQRHGGDPDFNFIGEINHVAGAATVYFDDNNAADVDTDYLNATTNGPDTGAAVATSQTDFNMGKTSWYTVRAVDAASCNPPNLSGHAGALYGVLRDRVGPDKPTGLINHCFCQPGIGEKRQNFLTEREGYGVDEDFRGAVVRVNRIDLKNREVIFKKIRSFEVQIGKFKDAGSPFNALFSRTYYFKGMSPFGEVVLPIEEAEGLTIRVRIRLDDRTVSRWASDSYQKNPTANGGLQVYQFDGLVSTICRPVSGPPGFVPGHYPVGSGGVITGISGFVNLTPSAKEVRVYRRVGHTASLQLVFKTAGNTLPASVPWSEGGPVIANGVEVCYYAQLFDEHGNGSPLVRIGCVTIVNDDFGVPLVTDPEPLAPLGGQGVLKLSWFCDPIGIERFEVWIASESGGEPVLASADLTGKLDTGTNSVLTTPDGDDLTFCIYQTLTLESGFGNGAEFELTLQVPYGKKYYYAIRPVGAMIPDSVGNFSRPEGDFSNLVCSAYAEPSAPGQAVVPWPARPLPGSANIAQPVSSFTSAEGPFYATALNPESMRNERCSGAILVGALPALIGEQREVPGTTLAPKDVPPLSWLFHYRKQSDGAPTADTESIRRFVVYRHQVPSTRFPKARPNLVQITPLIDRITFYDDKSTGARRIHDPFFTFKRYHDTSAGDFFVPSAGTFSRDPTTFSVNTAGSAANNNDYLKLPARFPLSKEYEGKTMWVRDTLPVTRGAHYQYLIVHFTVRGEIARVIPTNIISH